jgi:23S rRNA (adenine2503-C2)-methyltransferase
MNPFDIPLEKTPAREPLFGKTLAQLEEVTASLKLPRYTAAQIADWLYKKEVISIEAMSNLSKEARDKLSANYDFGVSEPVKVQTSVDGTKKYLFRSIHGKFIEAAYIPEGKRATLCVSSQVGCKMGCLFCMTGKQGFQGQLTAGEIVNQIRSLPERDKLTNIVYMGMGEPFDNLEPVMQSLELLTAEWGMAMSPKRITVSTIGIIPAMKVFLENSNCHLAVSLHSPFEEERRRLMPIEHVYSLHEVLDTIRNFNLSKQRRISFEYIVFKDMNHSPRHVKELARILNGIRCRINLMRFHPIPNTPLASPDDAALEAFKAGLEAKGITTTIRKSRGQDIFAACGLLSTKELQKKG